ncbi:MAG: efflux RND transporter periplasmic adaptor subunit [Proteobacteria bacterium]|nr:efflux RND transporter periplasmic adaptor subunit [Pseudomonadota bacterium]
MNDQTLPPTPDADMISRLGLNTHLARFSRRQIALAAGGALACLILLFLIFGGPKPEQYVTAELMQGPLSITVSATGTLAPRDQVDVGSEVSGRIDALYADYNDHVTKGQKLAKINTDQIQAQLDQARATLAQSHATLQQDQQTISRYAKLRKSNAVSPQEYDVAIGDYGRAKAGVALAQAQVKSYETQLRKATIFSPINGVVLDKKVSVGQTLIAAMSTPVLYTLASDLSQMELDVDIDEADVGAVKAGQHATFTVDAYPNRNFEATLISVHNAPQTTNNVVTYKGVLLVHNRGLLLKPGMTATATIQAAKIADTLMVPNAALRFIAPEEISRKATPPPSEASEGRVWTEDGRTLKPHDLKLGPTDGRFTQVLSGDLKAGDKVVTDIKQPDTKK